MDILLRNLPHVQEQKKRSYFPGRVNPNAVTLHLPGMESGTWLNTLQPYGPKQIRIQSTPGGILVCAPPLVEPQV